ncbi:benzoylformate decarboxylase [Myroides sp. LJL119]
MKTVRDKTFELLRELKITHIFGNPGSTEETFLQNLPEDFTYVQVLQEASAVAAADAFAQATKNVALVNVHTAAGVSNAMSGMLSARMNKTPVIITAGNQTRDMLLLEPWLTNTNPEDLTKPFVKWSYEPKRAEDVPAAFMRAYAMALQEPAGPVFLSIPLDDWNQPAQDDPVVRTVSSRVAPDPDRIKEFADVLNKAKKPLLIYGADISRDAAWSQAIELASKLNAPVMAAPASERTPFPEDHPLYAGALPFAIKPLCQAIQGYDVAIVIGAPVFRYYPYVAGDYLPKGLKLLHISNDPQEAGRAPVGDSLISNSKLALESLIPLVNSVNTSPQVYNQPKNQVSAKPSDSALSAYQVFSTVRKAMPENTILVQESPSNIGLLQAAWPITFHDGYYTMASGSLGWGVPAAVGVALAEKQTGRKRPVVAMIGDGSLNYAVQGMWTAKQHELPVIYVVPVNREYGILKSFSECQNTPNVPGLDLPDLDIASLAQGYGCIGKNAENLEDLAQYCQEALKQNIPTIIAIPITRDLPDLI